MSWRIDYTAQAARGVRKLDPQIRHRVRAAAETLRQDPYRGKPLQFQLKGMRSWRTGDYRIVWRVREMAVEILIVEIGHRREIYDKVRSRLR